MKQYMTQDQLRLVGKAWEIRYQLRKLSQAGEQGIALKQLLNKMK